MAPGWVDPEATTGYESSLTFTFVYLQDPTDMKSSKIIIKTQTDVTTYATVLPEGTGEDKKFKVGGIASILSTCVKITCRILKSLGGQYAITTSRWDPNYLYTLAKQRKWKTAKINCKLF